MINEGRCHFGEKKGRAYLGQEVITARSEGFMTITLQRACGQSNDNDRALEQRRVHQVIDDVRYTIRGFPICKGRCSGSAIGEDTDVIHPL